MNQSQFNNYWLKRIAAREKGYYRDADNLIRILRKEYARNFNALQKELAYLYETSLTNAKGEVLYKAKYVAQLMKDIDPKLAAQFLKQNKEMAKILGEVYENEFYHTVFDLGKSGMQFSFTPLDSRAVRKVLTYPWSGLEFSERIWDNKDVLI